MNVPVDHGPRRTNPTLVLGGQKGDRDLVEVVIYPLTSVSGSHLRFPLPGEPQYMMRGSWAFCHRL